MSSLIIILFLIGISVYLCNKICSFIKFKNIINKFPGRKTFWTPFGDALLFRKDAATNFQTFRKLAAEFPLGYRIWFFNKPVFILFKPEDVQDILCTEKYVDKDFLYEFYKIVFGEGLVMSDANKWKQRRRMLSPAFRNRILKKYDVTFGKYAEILINELQDECKKDSTNLEKIFFKTTFKTICDTTVDGSTDDNDQIAKHLYRGNKIANIRVNTLWLYNNFIFTLSKLGKEAVECKKILKKFGDKLINEKEKLNNKNNTNINNGEYNFSSIKKFTLLDYLLFIKNYKGQIDNDGINEEIISFITAGHESTGLAMTNTLLLLANYKNIQNKVIKEIDDVFQNEMRPATYQDLSNLPYLEMCIKEALRIIPPVNFIQRHIDCDTPIRDGKDIIPAGSSVVISMYDLHHNPAIYVDPEKFDPDRFLPENYNKLHPCAYIPFAAGPRDCIGRRYAMLEMKSFLSLLFQYYEVEPVTKIENMQFMHMANIRVKGNIFVKFKQRIKLEK